MVGDGWYARGIWTIFFQGMATVQPPQKCDMSTLFSQPLLLLVQKVYRIYL
jgi:hypothetical protein